MADVYSSCGCGTNCGDAPDVRVVAGNDLTVEALVSIYDEDKGYYAAFDLSGASDVRMRIVGAYSKVEGENVTVSGSKARALFKAGRYGAGNYGVEITFTRGQESFRVFERGLFSVVRDSGEASLGTSAEGGSGEGMNISVDVKSRTVRIGKTAMVTDYALIDNKPSINNVELSGNKTPKDLGMYSAEEADDLFQTKEFAAERRKWAGKSVARGRTLYAYGEPVAELKDHRGGHRDGSGRKRDDKDRRVSLTVRVTPRTKDSLDSLKGDLSYGKVIDKIVDDFNRGLSMFQPVDV